MLRYAAAGIVSMVMAGAVFAASLDGDATYDMLFRGGTLDEVGRDKELIYSRNVTNTLKPEAEARDTGDIALSFRTGDIDIALIEFRRDGKHRSLGTFPASVGNPMIMVFYETVVRDMAEAAGGSPDYIRNRVKEALIQPTDMTAGETIVDGRMVATQTIRMNPFAGDPNIDRMKGFGDLELRVTMSEDVPGWYTHLLAEASGGEVYKSELTFLRLDSSP